EGERLGGRKHLSQQHRSERLTSTRIETAEIVVARRACAVKAELATLITSGPAGVVVLMPAIFDSNLYGVLIFYPSQIISKLPTIIGFKTELSPSILTDRVIFRVVVSGKINQWRTRILRHKTSVAGGIEIWDRFGLACSSS